MAIPRNLANLAPKLSTTGGSFATTIGVGGATPATSGSGITFPATYSASTDVNTLDDYEEGDWTPSLEGSVSNPTVNAYNTRGGKYVKIGRLCFVTGILDFWITGGSGDVRIAGLPFTVLSGNENAGTRGVLGAWGPTWDANRTVLLTRPITGQTYMTIVGYGSNESQATLSYSTASFSSGDALYFSLCYHT